MSLFIHGSRLAGESRAGQNLCHTTFDVGPFWCAHMSLFIYVGLRGQVRAVRAKLHVTTLFWHAYVSFHIYGSILAGESGAGRNSRYIAVDFSLFWRAYVSFHIYGSLLASESGAGKKLCNNIFDIFMSLLAAENGAGTRVSCHIWGGYE